MSRLPVFGCRLVVRAELRVSKRSSDIRSSITDRTAAPLVFCKAPPDSPACSRARMRVNTQHYAVDFRPDLFWEVSDYPVEHLPSGAGTAASDVAAACEVPTNVVPVCSGVADSKAVALKLPTKGRASCALSPLTTAACRAT